MNTLSVLSEPSPEWDAYVRARPEASIYLLGGWSLLARRVFGHEPYFIEARSADGNLCGVLPVVRQKSLLFGKFMTSVPFFNYGGALADADDIVGLLMERALDLATDKVSMILRLPPDVAALSKQLGAKLRSQVKRSDRENPSVRIGGKELLPDFYEVFCRNMRDLGTPVYPRRFLEAIMEAFPAECLVVIVDREGRPAAAGFLVLANGRAEIPWAACQEDAKPAGFNMRLYWEALTAAIGRGCTEFDFGRSTVDSGTYRFKKQWGAQPLQLYWHRWERRPQRDEAVRPVAQGKVMRLAAAVWQRLPLGVANTLGPLVSPGLPW